MSGEAAAERGYRRFARALAGGWSRPETNLLVVPRVDSTNALAWRILRARGAAGGMAPLAVIAWSQERGRGRRGRAWASPAGGGLYASLLVAAPKAEELELLPLRVPVALCRRLDRFAGRPCRLKWPNDLVIGGAKIGGVLVESAARGATPVAAVAGWGVNLEPLAGDGLAATSLREESSTPPDLAELALALVEEVVRELARPASAALVAAEFARWSLHREGDRLACRTPAGEVRGAFCGFDRRGHLRLRSAGGLRLVAAGELVESGTS